MGSKYNSELMEILELLREIKPDDKLIDPVCDERIVVFSCMGSQFGILNQSVFEILRANEFIIYKVPRTRVGILGMINLRGDIIPIIDFKKRYADVNCDGPIEKCLQPEHTENHKTARIIIVQAKEIRFGLLVEQVIGIKIFPKDSFHEIFTPIIEFTVESDENPIFVLKLDELF